MPSLPSKTVVQRGKIAAPPIAEPEQLHPVELFYQCRDTFGWSTAEFAEVFGCELDTFYKWMQKRYNPNKWVKIYAASLKKEWQKEWGL